MCGHRQKTTLTKLGLDSFVEVKKYFKMVTNYIGPNSIAIPRMHLKMYFGTEIQNTVEKWYRDNRNINIYVCISKMLSRYICIAIPPNPPNE